MADGSENGARVAGGWHPGLRESATFDRNVIAEIQRAVDAANATVSSADTSAGAAATPSRKTWRKCSWPANSTSRLSAKYRKNVRSVRPAACAMSVTVVCSKPRSA